MIDFSNATVAVTGGAGFIGSHLVEKLRSLGASVIVIDSMEQGDIQNLDIRDPNIIIHRFKLGKDSASHLQFLLRGVDVVFHLAAQKRRELFDDSVLNYNVRGTEQLLTACAIRRPKKIVFTSSLYAYGRMSGPPMVETERPEPTTEYGVSKLMCEHACHRISVSEHIPITVLRLFFTYGPRYSSAYPSVITKNFRRMLAGHAPVIHGDGGQALDYIYVDDVVDALLAAAGYNKFGIFNVGRGAGVSVKDLIREMAAIAGYTDGWLEAPADWTAGSLRVADTEKFETQFEFAPETSLQTGLIHTFEWMKNQGII